MEHSRSERTDHHIAAAAYAPVAAAVSHLPRACCHPAIQQLVQWDTGPVGNTTGAYSTEMHM